MFMGVEGGEKGVNETLKAFVGTNANPHGCANV